MHREEIRQISSALNISVVSRLCGAIEIAVIPTSLTKFPSLLITRIELKYG